MKYAYSTDKEHYHGEFDSPEEAATECIENDDVDSCYVGEVIPPTPPETYIDVDAIIEHIQEQDDYNMEFAEDWPDASAAQRKELDEALTAAFAAWLDKHGLRPTHYVVHNVKHMTRNDI